MAVSGANGPLFMYFAYRDGDHSELLADHRAAFEGHDRFEYDSPFLETPFGNVELGYEDVPALTGMSHLDNYTYEADGENWDLLYAPLVSYYLGEGSYHLSEDGSDVSEARALRPLREIPNQDVIEDAAHILYRYSSDAEAESVCLEAAALIRAVEVESHLDQSSIDSLTSKLEAAHEEAATDDLEEALGVLIDSESI